MVVTVQVVIFCVVTKCSPVSGYQCFKGTRYLHLQGWIEGAVGLHIQVPRRSLIHGNGKGVTSWPEHHNLKMSSHYNEFKLTALSPCRGIVRSTGRGSRWCLVILWCSVLVWRRWIWIVWRCSCACTQNMWARLYCRRRSGCINRNGSCRSYRQWSCVCWWKCWSHRWMWICTILILTDNFRSFVCLIKASFSIAWYHVWLTVLAHFYRNSSK